ncbi:putative ddhd domain-containing protein [Botrytis fragariae]|uniref:Putative ddhd domain-containing protein n=1 Tax=Botrytis fragariae TaxID=1964551 RepID=A0A8H6AMC8_9HELO|nr:putative ddhd domain-containing protein [Botrytis fragariae]KAF5870398.1 putative ddhd domain-containing protein [Botrytis fragariae]
MSQPIHTFGKGCDLAPPGSSEEARKPCDEMPPMRAQFFYCSPLPLDDPLTAVPPPTADSKNVRHPPRPFPKCDNKVLLEAWLGMGSKRDRKSHNRTCKPKVGIEPITDKMITSAIGFKPIIKREAKELKESLKPTTRNPERQQTNTRSATQPQQVHSKLSNSHQELKVGEKEGKTPPSTISCPCKGSHLWCRKKAGNCKCVSCPKASQEVAEAKPHPPHASAPKTNDKPPVPGPVTKCKSKENLQEETSDHSKRSKHYEHNCKRERPDRGESEKDPKPEANPELECTCNQSSKDSNYTTRKSRETKTIYNRPTEPFPAESLKHGQQGKGKPEECKPHVHQPKCLCTNTESHQDSTDQKKRSKHWEHNCKKGKAERERSEKELNSEDEACVEEPEEKMPVETKLSDKGKGKAVALNDQDDADQVEKTKAWFDEQLKSQMEPDSTSFYRDQRHHSESTKSTEDSKAHESEEDICCVEDRKHNPDSLISRIPSCCDDSKAGANSKRQQSEAETTFSGRCEESKGDKASGQEESDAETEFSGICDGDKAKDPSKRKEYEAGTVFSGSYDKSKDDRSKQGHSESITRFGSCCDDPKSKDKQVSEGQTSGKQITERSTLKASSKNVSDRSRLFGRRQADGTGDQDDGLYVDSDEDLPVGYMVSDQGDATNDKCTCKRQSQVPEHDVLATGNGNIYTKSAKTAGSGTTGKPFLKLPARGESPQMQNNTAYDDEPPTDSRISHERESTEDMEVEGCKAYKHKEHAKCQVDIPVGTCRLHLVSLSSLILKPIYWSPLNDQYPCIYGTWFYKDNMCPVESAVANQLEKGYRENECWSQTWDDQLNSAIEVGAEGEEKIVHRLWPKENDDKTVDYDPSKQILSADPHCAARCFHGEAAAEGKVEELDSKPGAATSIGKKYPNSQVIYKNCEEAFILKPSICPSAYYGRRPLAKIKSGLCVGIPVVRGFNRKAWNKLHLSKNSMTATKVHTKSAKHSNTGFNILEECPACKAQDEPEKVTDLCLVIHGIGQKLSERMESFNFTYAVNSFRCEMKRELTNDDVKKVLREDFCGLTVLPVNWRANLSFEDGGPRKPGDKERPGCDFSLDDITQPTIPRVRQLISDVMLDIPYYMSGHKHKMIAALIAEANRIYRLWCKNNPGFHKNGRVHLISHSLGSVMALEVLSKQPTTLPAELSWRPNTKYFDFQTTNCFLAGSPCAFFLLLDSKSLVPRKGISKPGCECENGSSKDIFGDAGTFGCLAIDNLYNIMHCNDPIAYRLNACVDSRYGANLKEAEVPDSSRSFMTAVTHAMKSAAGMSQDEALHVGEMPRPTLITKMPSQMEMEVHDFTAEEMAEKKFCQLNENGQVDWILGNRPGMLANQYIDMLSAHSSYWNSRDFIRFLCVEIGRRSGKMHTLPNMRARKKSQK